MPTETTDGEPRLIINDTMICWVFPDGSHRGVTQDDVDKINWLIEYAIDCGIGDKFSGK